MHDWVSGDAGCTDPDLVKSAISFTANGLDEPQPVKVYLYIFNNKDAFNRHLGQVGPCATTFITDPTTYQQVAQSPYVLVGQGPWAPGIRRGRPEGAAAGGRHRGLTPGGSSAGGT